jgi:hypothetical protein
MPYFSSFLLVSAISIHRSNQNIFMWRCFMKNFAFFVVLFLTMFIFWGCQEAMGPETESLDAPPPMIRSTTPPPPDCDDGNCVRSPGYWKNHLDEWPVEGDEWYDQWMENLNLNKEMLQELMLLKGGKKNKWHTMFRSIIAAKLDLEILGSSHCKSEKFNTCICKVAQAGFDWLYKHNHMNTLIKGSSPCWRFKGERIYLELDAYYNGYLCKEAPVCD